MIELRPSCEHHNKPRHPTHIRRASAPTGPCPGRPGDQSDEETSAIPGRARGTQMEMRVPSGGAGGLSWPRLTASHGLWERCFTVRSFL